MADQIAPATLRGLRVSGPSLELPFDSKDTWSSLPTTKVRRPKSTDPFAWAYSYTAFSLDFAQAALRCLSADPASRILDPFVGSGTTIVAAGLQGCVATGIDVSPFSVLLARARVATKANAKVVRAYLTRNARKVSPIESSILSAADTSFALNVVEAMCAQRNLTARRLYRAILSDGSGEFDSEAVCLLSLAIGARECARVEKGSNPIWYRRTANSQRHSATKLGTAARRLSETMVRDLSDSAPLLRQGHRLINADFSDWTGTSTAYDVCLTSPPYLNRLDYVVAHLPELSILRLVTPIDLEDLRAKMIGTTKIIGKDTRDPPMEWGNTCHAALQAIADHASYASKRYYYHTYYHYFRKLYSAFRALKTMMTRQSRGLIVVQDSFYKNVPIQTPQICSEMLRSLAFNATIVRTAPVKQHMGRLSPTQAAYAPEKTLGEALLFFNQ